MNDTQENMLRALYSELCTYVPVIEAHPQRYGVPVLRECTCETCTESKLRWESE